ncbi:TlyA family RNA methyltransferase [Metallumcola ferriviriculae]|uniref:TlyA family RNA methyltransferase n=1 Tax=Metallumcola ferriviriculae TaxID=3039180 RepID=A0AAU0US37_9FIRM|nr:TlyA family RNA methyltransferase [Desulfitibacteraceae bacterium MK1]
MAKVRLDLLLVDRGFFPSREKAKANIMAGQVLVDEQKVDKAGTKVHDSAAIRIIGEAIPYVSRGGLKLAGAMEAFQLKLEGKVVLDIGASTGGFTDCALQYGAVKVFAVDVGYGQLAWKLRQDPRVICLERTNARYLNIEQLGEKVGLVTIDVAFISLEKILPALPFLLKEEGQVVALIKPQFEAGKEKVGKKGVVRDPDVHREVIENILECARELDFHVLGLKHSPIRGPEGNIEYLLFLGVSANGQINPNTKEVVSAAHRDV